MLQQNVHTDDLLNFAKILGLQTDFQEVLKLVAHKSTQLLKADLALILMLNPDTRETVKTVIKDGKDIKKDEYRDIYIHVGGWVITNSKPFHCKNIHKDNRFVKGLFKNVDVKSVSGVPLIIEGIIFGALILLYKNIFNKFDSNSINLLESFADISAPFLRNAQKIRPYFETAIPEASLLLKYKNVGLYGKSSKFVDLLKAIEAATKCDARVLLIGNTGTGKELIAKAIHKFSNRADSPFVAVDCGAIPKTLLESEFFGHKRGAFTGANSDRQGLFLEANGGTLFMDEINNLPFDMQSKLLRVLQEGEIRPVGSDKTYKVNVRILAASSSPLKALVDNNKFREDLFFRLHVYPIYIPDLNERKEDIPFLANYFLRQFAKNQNKKVTNFHEEVIDFIKHYRWKGNIRELENFVERLVTITPDDESIISAELFPRDLQDGLIQFRKKQNILFDSESLSKKVNKYEAEIIEKTLIECNWNQSETARRLKTSEKSIRYKIEKLNIRKPKAD